MKITMKKELKKGIEEKSRVFAEKGNEIYAKAGKVARPIRQKDEFLSACQSLRVPPQYAHEQTTRHANHARTVDQAF
jgi:hypothetical protein